MGTTLSLDAEPAKVKNGLRVVVDLAAPLPQPTRTPPSPLVASARAPLYSPLMSNRRKSRELAMQVLFLWDAHGSNDTEMALHALAGDAEAPDDARRSALAMAEGAWGQREPSTSGSSASPPSGPRAASPPVDRNILRLGIWELTNTDTPPKVVLDEAIELARQFSTEQSPAFVNGVLDAVLRENKALTQGSAFRVQGSGEGAAAAPPPLNPEP